MMNTYEKLNEAKSETAPLINWHFTRLLTSIKRKLTLKQTFRNPWQFSVVESIHISIFRVIYGAVRDYRSEEGRPQPSVHCKTVHQRSGLAKSYEITFSSFFSLIHHLTKLSNPEAHILEYLRKVISKNEINVVVTEEKPVKLFFKVSTSTLTVTGHFQVKNQYGILCSF